MALDLKALVASVVGTAFEVAQSIQDAGTYYKVTATTYDPTAGTSNKTTVPTSVGAIFGMFKQNEMDGQMVQWGDKKIFIKQSELPVEPQRDDYYIDSAGTRWDLDVIGVEPTRSIWILRGRAHRP